MQYRTLGRTGVKVSQLCFGTMSFGGDADEATSAQMFNRTRDAGINFYDTADAYAMGRSEEILGRLIADCRDDIVLTSKVFNPMRDDINARGLSRRHIMQAVEASLKRLKTDRIDLYFCHEFDGNTPIDETLRALDDLVHQGKILHAGVSNWAAWQFATAQGIAARDGLAPIECLQPMYSLIKRAAEIEILPCAVSEEIGVISYSPLGAGLLTGKYGRDKRPESGRLIDNDRYSRRYDDGSYYDVADRFVAHAAAEGVHPATLAVAWVMKNPAITAPIIGARNLEQLESSLMVLDYEFTDAHYETITALSIDPPIATDRAEEK